MFHHYEKRIIHSSDDMNGFIAEGHVDAFLWLFGEDFFEKGE